MRNRVLIYSAIIFASTLVVYWYSFFQLLKSETYFFFWRTHVIGQLEWWQFFTSPSGYAPGDTWLFRPLLYVIDALRQAWFGTNYTYWHIFGLGLHLLACFCLFRLLWKLKPGVLAFAVTLMFSLSSVLVGAVLYEDINGYQLFVALILTAFYYAYEYVQNGNNKDLWISFACAVVSCFVYEVGLLIVIVLIAYLALQKKRGWGIYLAFLPFYILIYFVSNIGNPIFNHEVNIIMNQNYVLMGLQNAFVIGVRWFCEILLPNSFTLTPLPEIRYQPVSFGDAFDDVALLTNVGLFVDLIILGIVVYGIVSAKNKSNIWVYLLGGLAVVYLLVISIYPLNSESRSTE